MGKYNISQQKIISDYRTLHKVPVMINDEAVVEMIKEEMIKTGKLYPEFASLLDKNPNKTKSNNSLFELSNNNQDFVSYRLEKISEQPKTEIKTKKTYLPQERALARKYIAAMLKNQIIEAIYGNQGFNVISNPNKISGAEAWQELESAGAYLVHNLHLGQLGIKEPLNRDGLAKDLNTAFRQIEELEALVDYPKAFDKKYKEITHGKTLDYSAVIDYLQAVNKHQSAYMKDKLSTLEQLKEPAQRFEKTLNIPAVKDFNKWAGRQETGGSLTGLAIDMALAYMSGGMGAASRAAMKTGQGVTKVVTEQAVKTGMKRETAEIAGQFTGITTSQVTGAGLNSAMFQATKVAGALEDGNFTMQEFDEIGSSYIGLSKFAYVGSAISGPMGAKFGEWVGRLINNDKTISIILNSSLKQPTTLGKVLTNLSEHTGFIKKSVELGVSGVINTEYMAQDEGISFEEALKNLAQMEGVSKIVMAFLGGKTTKFLTPEKVQKITTELNNCKVETVVYKGQKAIKVITTDGKENFFSSYEELIAFVADKIYTEAAVGNKGVNEGVNQGVEVNEFKSAGQVAPDNNPAQKAADGKSVKTNPNEKLYSHEDNVKAINNIKSSFKEEYSDVTDEAWNNIANELAKLKEKYGIEPEGILVQNQLPKNVPTKDQLGNDNHIRLGDNDGRVFKFDKKTGKLVSITVGDDYYLKSTSGRTLHLKIDGTIDSMIEAKFTQDEIEIEINGEKITHEQFLKSEVPGQYTIYDIEPNGKKYVIGLVEYMPNGGKSIEQNVRSLDGTKTDFVYQNDARGNRILYKKITSPDGKVQFETKKTYKVLSENHYQTSTDGEYYDVLITDNKVKVTKLDGSKNSTDEVVEYDIVDLSGTKIDWNQEYENEDTRINDIFKQLGIQDHKFVIDKRALSTFESFGGDEWFKLAQSGTKLLYGDCDIEGNAINSKSIIGISKGLYGDTPTASHETGHSVFNMLDLANDAELRKIYEAEKEEITAMFPDAGLKVISYMLKGNENNARGLNELVAETNLMNSMPQQNEIYAQRTVLLQKYFPKTIAYISNKINKISLTDIKANNNGQTIINNHTYIGEKIKSQSIAPDGNNPAQKQKSKSTSTEVKTEQNSIKKTSVKAGQIDNAGSSILADFQKYIDGYNKYGENYVPENSNSLFNEYFAYKKEQAAAKPERILYNSKGEAISKIKAKPADDIIFKRSKNQTPDNSKMNILVDIKDFILKNSKIATREDYIQISNEIAQMMPDYLKSKYPDIRPEIAENADKLYMWKSVCNTQSAGERDNATGKYSVTNTKFFSLNEQQKAVSEYAEFLEKITGKKVLIGSSDIFGTFIDQVGFFNNPEVYKDVDYIILGHGVGSSRISDYSNPDAWRFKYTGEPVWEFMSKNIPEDKKALVLVCEHEDLLSKDKYDFKQEFDNNGVLMSTLGKPVDGSTQPIKICTGGINHITGSVSLQSSSCPGLFSNSVYKGNVKITDYVIDFEKYKSTSSSVDVRSKNNAAGQVSPDGNNVAQRVAESNNTKTDATKKFLTPEERKVRISKLDSAKISSESAKEIDALIFELSSNPYERSKQAQNIQSKINTLRITNPEEAKKLQQLFNAKVKNPKASEVSDDMVALAVEHLVRQYNVEKVNITQFIESMGFNKFGHYECRVKSDTSLFDKISNYLKDHPDETFADAMNDVRDCYGGRFVLDFSKMMNDSEVVKLVNQGKIGEAKQLAAEKTKDELVKLFRTQAEKNPDMFYRVSNYVTKEGNGLFDESHLFEMRRKDIGSTQKGLDCVVLSTDEEVISQGKKKSTKSQRSGYCAFQVNLTINGRSVELQFKTDEANKISNAEHWIYDMVTGKDIVGRTEKLEDFVSPLRTLVLDTMPKEVYDNYYAKYTSAWYNWAELKAEGKEVPPEPKLQDFAPEGTTFDPRLSMKNLILFDEIAGKIKHKEISFEEGIKEYNERLSDDDITT